MNKLLKYYDYLNTIVRVSILIDVFYRCRNSTEGLWIFFICYLFIQVNDYLRLYYFYKDYRKYYASLFTSMVLSSIAVFNLSGYSDVYMFLLLYEIIFYSNGKMFKLLTIIETCLFIFIVILRGATIEELLSIRFWQYNILDLIMSILLIATYLVACLSYKALLKEKRRVEKLNKELEQSYNKLEEQSKRIEELVITEERNRIARDIHDNLGHTLVALNMNLDVAENLIDRDLEKTKEILSKSRNLAKDSLNDLRKAVYALKEENVGNLSESIKRMVDNVESTGKIKVSLSIDEKANELLSKYKDIICISVKEALTNSIKHGKASEMHIDIKVHNNNAYIMLKDNGLGCNTFIKGNGLLSIEKRIRAIGGKVNYSSIVGKGFEIGIELSL